jgi:hypothetical protein
VLNLITDSRAIRLVQTHRRSSEPFEWGDPVDREIVRMAFSPSKPRDRFTMFRQLALADRRG